MKYTLTAKHNRCAAEQPFTSRVALREAIRLDLIRPYTGVRNLPPAFMQSIKRLDALLATNESFNLTALSCDFDVVAEPSGPIWGIQYTHSSSVAARPTVTDSFDAAIEFVANDITRELAYRDSFTEVGEEPLDRSEYHDAMRTLYAHAAAKQAGKVTCWGCVYSIEVVA